MLRTVLDGVSFSARPGEFILLIGPSGCGKTTLLRTVHGLERASAGSVACGGRAVTAPDHPRAIVFQHFNLFRWRTMAENIRFGIEVRGDRADQQAAKVDAMVRLGGLTGFAEHRSIDLPYRSSNEDQDADANDNVHSRGLQLGASARAIDGRLVTERLPFAMLGRWRIIEIEGWNTDHIAMLARAHPV